MELTSFKNLGLVSDRGGVSTHMVNDAPASAARTLCSDPTPRGPSLPQQQPQVCSRTHMLCLALLETARFSGSIVLDTSEKTQKSHLKRSMI